MTSRAARLILAAFAAAAGPALGCNGCLDSCLGTTNRGGPAPPGAPRDAGPVARIGGTALARGASTPIPNEWLYLFESRIDAGRLTRILDHQTTRAARLVTRDGRVLLHVSNAPPGASIAALGSEPWMFVLGGNRALARQPNERIAALTSGDCDAPAAGKVMDECQPATAVAEGAAVWPMQYDGVKALQADPRLQAIPPEKWPLLAVLDFGRPKHVGLCTEAPQASCLDAATAPDWTTSASYSGHETMVAGVAVGRLPGVDGGAPVSAGVAAALGVLPIDVRCGSPDKLATKGEFTTSESLVAAIDRAAEKAEARPGHKGLIVNMSFTWTPEAPITAAAPDLGASGADAPGYPSVFCARIAETNGLFVAAAGNVGAVLEPDVPPYYPVACNRMGAGSDAEDNLVRVTGTNPWGAFTKDQGPAWIDLGAPGTLCTAAAGTLWNQGSGSSLAAPFVGAVAGAAWALDPGLSSAALRVRLVTTGQGDCESTRYGSLDIKAALGLAPRSTEGRTACNQDYAE